ALGGAKRGRDALDERRRRLIGDEAAHELGGGEARGGRGMEQQAQDSLAVVLAAARGYPQAEDGLLAAVVHPRTEDEARGVARTVDRPARERARHLGDVLLRVAAVDAERVQLHQLARVVLVEAGALAAVGPDPRREVRSPPQPAGGGTER